MMCDVHSEPSSCDPPMTHHTDAPGVTFEVATNGSLVFMADAQGVEWLKENRGDKVDLDVFFELLENKRCNGSFTPFDAGNANPFVGLTSAPCIAETMDVDDDGRHTPVGRVWYYQDYQLKDMVEVLIQTGRVSFREAPDVEPAPSMPRP